MPNLYMVCGPNGAGKSTVSKAFALRQNIFCIDPDALAVDGLSPVGAGKAAVSMARHFLQHRISFARESTLSSNFDFRLMADAREAGYVIRLLYIRLNCVEIALARVATRVQRGGHDVPEADVRRRFQRSLENLPRAMAFADSYTILDNSGDGYTVVDARSALSV